MRPRRRRQRAQSLVEFAIALPLFVLFVFAIIELALVMIFYYSETRMTRETARWLAIRPNSTDAEVAAHVQSTVLPGMAGGSPVLVVDGTSALSTVYDVGRMRVTFVPCLPSASVCTHANRAAGATLFVDMRYDASHILFLPTTFRMGTLVVTLPTTLPTYRVFVMVE